MSDRTNQPAPAPDDRIKMLDEAVEKGAEQVRAAAQLLLTMTEVRPAREVLTEVQIHYPQMTQAAFNKFLEVAKAPEKATPEELFKLAMSLQPENKN